MTETAKRLRGNSNKKETTKNGRKNRSRERESFRFLRTRSYASQHKSVSIQKKKKENRPFVRPALSFSLLCGSLPSACCGNLCERCRHPCACIIKAEKESGRSFVVVVGGVSGGCRRGASPTQMTGSSPGREGGGGEQQQHKEEMANYLRECLVKSSGESLNNVCNSQQH